MTDPAEAPQPVWDRLRASLELMRAAREQKADPAALARRLAERAQLLRGRTASTGAAETLLTFVAFNKGRERYGIPLENVLEVQALDQLSAVPNAPPAIRGVIHWRGSILALLDLSRLFQVAESGLADIHASVIVEAAGKRLAVAANEVEEILSVPRSRVREAPALSGDVSPEWVTGVSDDNRLILRMDEIVKFLGRKQ